MNTSLRNWQKARLAGFCLNKSLLTELERYNYAIIEQYQEAMLKNWDKHTAKLIGHELPPHKCKWCGRRGTKEYLVKGENYCYQHSKAASI